MEPQTNKTFLRFSNKTFQKLSLLFIIFAISNEIFLLKKKKYPCNLQTKGYKPIYAQCAPAQIIDTETETVPLLYSQISKHPIYILLN